MENVATVTVLEDLGMDIVRAMYYIAKRLVEEQDGLDYILAFKGRGMVIDQINNQMKKEESPKPLLRLRFLEPFRTKIYQGSNVTIILSH